MTTKQQPYRPHHNNNNSNTSEIIHLSSLSGYQSLGTMLALLRTRAGKNQQEIAEACKPYLRSRKLSIDRRMYGRLENDDRFIAFAELEPIFRVYVEHYGLMLSDAEVELYVVLAQQRLAQKRKKREKITDEQWDHLAETLAAINSSRRSRIRLVVEPSAEIQVAKQGSVTESPSSRRLTALKDLLRTDTSHLLERENWLQDMLKCLNMQPSKKLVVVQGAMGVGKSHALALLAQRFVEQGNLYLIHYRFVPGTGQTPEDQLTTFLATIIADLLQVTADEKQQPVKEQIEQVLSAIKTRASSGQRVIILLDDAQEIFPSAAEWSLGWEHFMRTFVKEPHNACLYLFTRAWPGWQERRQSYLEITDLVDLSPEAGIEMWHRCGFSQVPDELLQRIVARWGSNPQLIEMRAAGLQKSFTYGWRRLKERVPKKNDQKDQLEALLNQESLFDQQMDIDARKMLQHVVTTPLSHLATRMLEVLALSPLGLPFALLAEEFPRWAVTYDELVRASLIDLNQAAADRAAVIPLAREAEWQSLVGESRAAGIEQRVTDLYALWLGELQDFRDDAEKAALITEMIVRFIRQDQMLKAAELFVSYGWLCALFAQVARILRVFEEKVKNNRGKVESAEFEVGRLLLQHHIALKIGRKITTTEREQIYQNIYDKVLKGEVTLQPFSEIDMLHHMMLMFLRRSSFTEAEQMFEKTLIRLRLGKQLTPEVDAAYLNNKARLLARLCEKAERDQDQDEAQRLKWECVAALKETIDHWRQCLRNALPLQEHYVQFKLARALNDYAYRQRLCGNLEIAQEAIEESLRLKKMSGVLPHSLAISLSEYSQVLAIQGRIQQALDSNKEAVTILESLVEDGDLSHRPELGVCLIERAEILKMQARLSEAKELLERAIPLIGDKPSRQNFCLKAEREIEEITFATETGRHYQLDSRWYSRYHALVSSFDYFAWLAHAGPFNDDEQSEWKRLWPLRGEEEVYTRMTSLIVQTRQREFAISQEEKRIPKLWYPLIPLEEVHSLINSFGQLQREIEVQETNAIIRSLYVDTIGEHIMALRQCEATAQGDQDVVWQCNLSLYGKPNAREFYIALQSLCKMVLEAQSHEQAREVAQDVLLQLKAWGLSPHDIVAMKFFSSEQESVPSFKKKLSDGERKFSYVVVQQFFQDVFAKEYHADDWRVEIAPARDGVYIDANQKTLFLPPKSFSVEKIRELLAEEVETHAYRSLSGMRSPLALLGSGLARYNATEEGLANHYIQQVSSYIYGDERSKTWIGTLATGLASGVLTPALSFYELALFLEKTFLVSRLLSGKFGDEAVVAARQQAWVRAARTFRGVPHLTDAGCCSLKDVIYLRGYLAVQKVLGQVEENRLFVGKMGIEHLEALAELNIVAPYYTPLHLALAPNLFDRLSLYRA